MVALSLSALVAAAAFAGLSAVLDSVESTRAVAGRTQALNRTFMLLNRDIRQLVSRPVRDELDTTQPTLSGGRLARFPLTLTRAGWHNSTASPRSHLQRVSYYLEDEALWRMHYLVLDRSSDSEPVRTRLLDGVESLEVRFLASTDDLRPGRGSDIDSRDWPESWVREVGIGTPLPAPPAALELRLELTDLGPVRRLYVLPPL